MRPEKVSIDAEVREKIEKSGFVLLADYRGMKAGALEALRRRVKGPGARAQVVKNVYLKRIAEERGWKDMLGCLGTPTAMVFGDGDAVAVAKALKAFVDECSLPALKGGVLGNVCLSAGDVKQLATLPSRECLLAMLAGALAAPIAGLATVLSRKLAGLPTVLRAIADKKEGKA